MGKKALMASDPKNRKERRIGMHGQPSEWFSANSILSGHSLDPKAVEEATNQRKARIAHLEGKLIANTITLPERKELHFK